jgi:signal transduction histidine kinase
MHSNPRFFSRILLPSMGAVLLFLVAIYLFVIPNYRESLMDGKRETIRELTSTAWSVMHKLDLMVSDEFSEEKARQEAAIIISDMRWGEEFKDYFWITDTTPRMVMHPYRPSMNGMDLSDYKDQRGKNFFVDIVKLVKQDGDGYIDYKWQWKDDSLTVVSKLSYVKAYEPWGWIVGTGIYIEDVNRQIEILNPESGVDIRICHSAYWCNNHLFGSPEFYCRIGTTTGSG